MDALKDSSPAVRKSVVRSLGQLGDPIAADSLSRMTTDPDIAVVTSAKEALETITK